MRGGSPQKHRVAWLEGAVCKPRAQISGLCGGGGCLVMGQSQRGCSSLPTAPQPYWRQCWSPWKRHLEREVDTDIVPLKPEFVFHTAEPPKAVGAPGLEAPSQILMHCSALQRRILRFCEQTQCTTQGSPEPRVLGVPKARSPQAIPQVCKQKSTPRSRHSAEGCTSIPEHGYRGHRCC